MSRITYTYKSYPNCPRATEYSQERERISILLSGSTVIFSIGVVIAFFIYTYALFSEGNWGNFLTVILYTILTAFFDAYMFVLRNNNTECNLNIILFEESVIKKINYLKEQIQDFDKEKRKDELSKLKMQYIEEVKTFKKETKKKTRENNIEFLKRYFLYFFLGMFIAISVVGIIQGISDGNPTTIFVSLVSFLVLGFWFFYTLPIGKKAFTKIIAKKENSHNTKKQLPLTKEKLFCRKCGTQILPDSVYCNKCGSKIEHF